jgi:formate-dependent nitrite reductase cytochrome c552 subunit
MISPHTIVVTANVITLQECQLYRGHACAVINAHHICPKSWFEASGKPVVTPMAMICPNCHSNVHAAIDGRIRGRDTSLLPPRCRALADRAFEIATANGLTPGLTL